MTNKNTDKKQILPKTQTTEQTQKRAHPINKGITDYLVNF